MSHNKGLTDFITSYRDRTQEVHQGLEEDVLNPVAVNDRNAGVPRRDLSLVSGQETHRQEDVVVQEERV